MAVIFCCLLSGQASLAQIRYITVDAEAEIIAKPDQLRFTVALYGEGKTPKKAKASLDELRAKFNATFDVMKFKGLSKKTVEKSITDASDFGGGVAGMFGGGPPPEGEDEAVYVTEVVELKVDGIDKLTAKQLDEMMEKYYVELKKLKLATSSGFTSGLKDDSKQQKELIVAAMKKAKQKASLIAELSDGKIGKVLSVEKTEFALFRSDLRDMFLERLREAGYAGGYGGLSAELKLSTKLRVKFQLTD